METNLRKIHYKEIEELLEIMEGLADKPLGKSPNEFMLLFQLIYRLCISCFRGIYTLTEDEKLGDSALTLARKILEAVITIEYLLIDNKTEKVKQFIRYLKVQHYQLSQYKRQAKIEDREREANVKNFEAVRDEFTFDKKTGETFRSWSKRVKIEDMIQTIRDGVNQSSKPYNKQNVDDLGRIYAKLCWKNHINPYDTLNYLKKASFIQSATEDTDEAIYDGFFLMYNLTIRFRNELEQQNKKLEFGEYDGRLIKVKEMFYGLIF